MTVPKSIKILGKKYKLTPKSIGNYGSLEKYGEFDACTCDINYLDSQNEQQMGDTILHEAIHAIDETMQIGLEEEQVHALGAGVYALLKENPALVKWIMGISS